MSEERKFLHDISSPITTMQLNLENAMALLEDKKPEDLEQALKMLGSCVSQILRVAAMVQARREVLMKGESA